MVGDIVGRLKIDTAEWQRGLQQAIQSLQQFGQAKDRIISNLSTLQQSLTTGSHTFQQYNQTLNATQQTFAQNIQIIQQFNTTLNETNITINQARQAASGFGSAWSTVLQIAGGIGLATSIQGIVSALRSMA